MRYRTAVCAACALLLSDLARAEEPLSPPRPTHNMYGMTGLIDVPTADMQPDGQFTVTASYFGGFLRNTIAAQLLPGVEAAFRYSILEETLGPGLTLFDRSFDIKVRVLSESDSFPAVAIGLQDFLGTGVYASEYVVGTKGFETDQFGSFRVTGGLGWGRFADRDHIRNPLSVFDTFAVREGFTGTGGEVSFGQFFSGRNMGFFGGVEWLTPIEGVTVKAEYSPDLYLREEGFEPDVPVNFGIQYRPLEEVEIGAYYMYGEEFGVRVSISGNPFQPLTNFDLEPGPQPVRERPPPADTATLAALGDVVNIVGDRQLPARLSDPRLASVRVHRRLGAVRWAEAVLADGVDRGCPEDLAAGIDAELGVVDVVTFNRAEGGVLCTVALRPAGYHAVRVTRRAGTSYPVDWYDQPGERDKLVAAVAEELSNDNLGLMGIEIAPRRISVYIENRRYRSQPRAVGRTARALTRTLPPSIEVFEITPVERSVPVTTIVLQRSQIEDQVERPDAAQRAFATARIQEAAPVPWSTLMSGDIDFPRYNWSISPDTPTSLFDPDQPFRIDFSILATGRVEFAPGLSANAAVSKRLFGDLDEIERGPGSAVEEQVRSRIADYLEQGDPAVLRLTLDHNRKLAPALYGRLTTGLFERMYAGVSGEILWKQAGRDWGVGLELNYVRQRGFNTLFDLRDYDTLTGHMSFYWDTNFYGLAMQIDAGRYLAGDWGATFGLKRRFANGWELGGFFTLTNIPFDEFGEGSFDRGIFLTIPFNWGLPYESQSQYALRLRPLTRDGGQRVDVPGRLYGMVEDQDIAGYRRTWEDFWE